MGAHELQPSTANVPLKVLGSVRRSSVAVKVRPSPQAAAPDLSSPRRSAPKNCALMVLPSIVPVVFAPLRVTTRVLPDCKIERGVFETEERKLPQGEAERWLAPGSIFQAPSTENGADKPRPVLRTPTSPSKGSPTRRMYAITKLRFVCEIAVSPCRAAVPSTRSGLASAASQRHPHTCRAEDETPSGQLGERRRYAYN